MAFKFTVGYNDSSVTLAVYRQRNSAIVPGADRADQMKRTKEVINILRNGKVTHFVKGIPSADEGARSSYVWEKTPVPANFRVVVLDDDCSEQKFLDIIETISKNAVLVIPNFYDYATSKLFPAITDQSYKRLVESKVPFIMFNPETLELEHVQLLYRGASSKCNRYIASRLSTEKINELTSKRASTPEGTESGSFGGVVKPMSLD